ncbi:MAG: hypothetical protein HN712_18650 [Gemmatimonadetes bacterium]|jgi:hypothetical protein|nr:hypothetical protein [Gemmatimonadota bacterium]MBT6146339.1 hypothetical protein [Gemmatimonadota bacterium]MBT7862345.1 hypothetical protein [Gemmatimonadota bacterium]
MRSLCLLILVLVGCSHDAKRENPLDPELTPPVTLGASLSDSTGTLTWTPYAGEQPLALCIVQRKVQGQEQWVALDSLTSAEKTTYIDASLAPGTAYDYRVVVVGAGGLEVPSSRQSVLGYAIAPVSLRPVEADATLGYLQLRWTRFRSPGFTRYTVVRRQVGTDLDTVLFHSADIADTAFADTSALHQITYGYVIQVEASGQVLSSTSIEGHLALPSSALSSPEMISESAAAALSWSAYSGPRFGWYEVSRRTEVLAPRVVYTTADVSDTSFTDAELLGNTQYMYQVDVVTARGETVAGNEEEGSFHALRQTFDLSPFGGTRPLARLYGRERGVRTLLTTADAASLTPRTLRELELDSNLHVERDRSLLVFESEKSSYVVRTPGGTSGQALAALPGEERLLSLLPLPYLETTSGTRGGLVAFDADEIVNRGKADLSLSPPGPVAAQDSTCEVIFGPGKFIDIQVTDANGQPIPGRDGRFGDFGSFIRDMPTSISPLTVADIGLTGRAVETLNDLGPVFRVDLAPAATYSLRLDLHREVAVLTGQWQLADGTGATDSVVVSLDRAVGLPVTIHLQARADGVNATLTTPVMWSPAGFDPTWTAMAPVGDAVLFTLDHWTRFIDANGQLIEGTSLTSRPSELRTWATRRGAGVGACLTEENMILAGEIPDQPGPDWASYLTRKIGPAVGPGDFLAAPKSFDVGPDGRIYVLDAGNSRIVVFGSDRRYVTQWGTFGDGAGQFQFGGGNELPNNGGSAFSGSVAVDGEGYIYVADELNRRIQVFEP